MTDCPVCSGELTSREVYDSGLQELFDRLCDRHEAEQLEIHNEVWE